MSTPSSATISPHTPKSTKKPTKIVVLQLPAATLARFLPPKPNPRKASKAKLPPLPTASSASPLGPDLCNENASESNSTPAPPGDLPPPADLPKKNGLKGPRPGTKRGLGQGTDAVPKPRGKPGPKKKPRLEDGTIDHGVKATIGGAAPLSTHKLGPKANQGAINAGLRALDRTGKPCRKWERKPFSLKSFTGVIWELPSWRSPQSRIQHEDDSTDRKEVSQQSGSNSKANESSTAADSSGVDQGDPMILLGTPTGSSPAPVMAAVTT